MRIRLTVFEDLPKRFGIFGGTFDPVQIAHRTIVELAHRTKDLEQIVCIPTAKNPLKDSRALASNDHRMNMLALAFEDCSYVSISDIEVKSDEAANSYTIDTLRRIRSQIGTDSEIVFIAGSDVLPNLGLWKEPKEIFSLISECFVVERDKADREALSQLKTTIGIRGYQLLQNGYCSGIPMPVSSTEIRDLFKAGKDTSQFLQPKVLNYIKENKLYI